MPRLVRWETVAGPEWTDGRMTVTPLARSVTFGSGLGDPRGGSGRRIGPFFRHSRPSAVVVSVDGSVSRIPIVDATRGAQLAIILIASLVLWGIWARTKTRKERS